MTQGALKGCLLLSSWHGPLFNFRLWACHRTVEWETSGAETGTKEEAIVP